MALSHTPPSFTPGSVEPPPAFKRSRAGSISGRLRSASDLCDDGFINKEQKGTLKDLIIADHPSLEHAFDRFERGDTSELKDLLNREQRRRGTSLDLVADDLDLDSLSMGRPRGSSGVAGRANVQPAGDFGGLDPMFNFDDIPFDLPFGTAISGGDGTAAAGARHGSMASQGGGGGGAASGATMMAAPPPGQRGSFDFGAASTSGLGALHDLVVGGPGPSLAGSASSVGLMMSPSAASGGGGRRGSREASFDFGVGRGSFDFGAGRGSFDHGGMLSLGTGFDGPVHASAMGLTPPENALTFNTASLEADKALHGRGPVTGAAPAGSRTSLPPSGASAAAARATGSKPSAAGMVEPGTGHDGSGAAGAGARAGAGAKPSAAAAGKMSAPPPAPPISIPGSASSRSAAATNAAIAAAAARADDGKDRLGAYSPKARAERLQRFYEGRNRRVWQKTVKYDVRKNFADSRVRVKGRFVKKEDEVKLRDFVAEDPANAKANPAPRQ